MISITNCMPHYVPRETMAGMALLFAELYCSAWNNILRSPEHFEELLTRGICCIRKERVRCPVCLLVAILYLISGCNLRNISFTTAF